ncbi:MAG: hypothetical protein N2595_01510 [bacterium]|nr:hypothetical protein [bacterium]
MHRWFTALALYIGTDLAVLPAFAAPAYYGFGYPHLVVAEYHPALYTAKYALVGYDTPIRAKTNGEFLSRFVWQEHGLANLLTGGLAIGNFWPGNDTCEFLVMFRRYGLVISGEVYRAPGVYSTRPWDWQSSWFFASASAGGSNDIVCVAAGDVLPAYPGDELLIVQSLSDHYRIAPRHHLLIYSRPSSTNQSNWILRGTSPLLPEAGMEVVGMTAGDFAWAGRTWLAVMYRTSTAQFVRYYDVSAFPSFVTKGEDATSFGEAAPFTLTSADYTKEYGREGQKYLTTIIWDGTVYRPVVFSNAFGVPPRALPMIDGWFNYRMVAYTNAPIAAAAGRVFGYLTDRYDYSTQYRDPLQGPGRRDVGVAWIARRPIYSKQRDPFHPTWSTHFGWPLPGEPITNTVVLENSGTAPTLPGTLRLKAWFNTSYRNADTAPATMYSPDTQLVINSSIPTFVTPVATQYALFTALVYGTNWPYQFDNFMPTRRLILSTEYWNVISIENLSDADADACERNNRHEMAVHAWTLHPVFFPKTALTNDYRPNVKNDPHSILYILHKLNNAIQSMWERSGTSDNDDIKIRVTLDGFELDDVDNAHRSWIFNGTNVWHYYEGCRGLDYNPALDPYGQPYGVWPGHGVWQRFNRDAEGDEGHETTHLFHQLGDLYQYHVFPKDSAGAILGNARPLQIRTWCANPDVFSTDARMQFCKGTADLHRYTPGMRNMGHENWGLAAPATNFARVRARNGAPLAGAVVKSYVLENGQLFLKNTVTTAADGLADINWPPRPLTWSGTDSVYGYRKYNGPALGRYIFITITLPGYSDGWVWRQDDPEYMHSSNLALPARAFVNSNWDIWDVPTLYEPNASPYPHATEIVVEGTSVRISTVAIPGNTYRVYRRSPPTYTFHLVTSAVAVSSTLQLSPPLGSGQQRAIFYLTEVTGTNESNPRAFQVVATSNARAITARDSRTLFLTLNAGTADPIMTICEGSEPFAEVATHWFFGHQPIKAQPASHGAHVLMTISSYSEWGIPPVYVTWVPRLSEFNYGIYDVNGNFAGGWHGTFDTAPQQLLTDPGNNFIAKNVQVGDEVGVGNVRTSIVEVVSATQLRLAAQVLPGGGTAQYSVYRTMGREGSGTTNRMVSRYVRGIGRVHDTAGGPYVGIADMGNNRVLVWEETTKYRAHYAASGFAPTDVDPDPVHTGRFFVISRGTDKKLYCFQFDGVTITLQTNWSLSTLATDSVSSSARQCGLAVLPRPNAARLVAVSDAGFNRVLVYELFSNDVLTLRQTITAPLPPFIAATLAQPLDVEFLHDPTRGLARLFAVANGNRVVKLLDDIVTAVVPPFVDITNQPIWVTYGVTHITLGGTNGGQVLGTMHWSNALNGASGTLPAAPAWQISSVPLALGANLISVSGTNAAGTVAVDTTMVTRLDPSAELPFVDVLSTNITVPYDVFYVSVQGTNNVHVVGGMTLTTSAGDVRSFPALSPWTVSNVFVAVGETVIQVTGTNAYGMPAADTIQVMRTTYAVPTASVNVQWTTLSVPQPSGAGCKLGTDGRFLYYLPGNNSSVAFYRYDPQSNTWLSLASHPGRADQHRDVNNNGLEYRDGFFFCALTAPWTNRWNDFATLVARYQVANDQWVVVCSDIVVATLYAPTSTNVLYGNAPAWNLCLVTLGLIDTVCTSTPSWDPNIPTGNTHTRFDCQGAGTQGNWTKRFDAHCAAFDDFVYGVKQDWNPPPYDSTNASIGDVVWRVPKTNIVTGAAVAVTNLPWNPGAGLCAISTPAARALTRQNEIVVVRGAGVGANQDGWGTPTRDIAVLSLPDCLWRTVTPLPAATGLGTDITEIGGELFVKPSNNALLYRGTPLFPGDTNPPDIDVHALVFPRHSTLLFPDVITNITWNPRRISDNYDGTNVFITRVRVLRSNDLAQVALVTTEVANACATVTWLPTVALTNATPLVIELTARDMAQNASARIFVGDAFYVIPESLGMRSITLMLLAWRRRSDQSHG